tara:strand:- start:3183 stop:3374 length:192 start_codon:yes stop_codon:yes gene_type:complete
MGKVFDDALKSCQKCRKVWQNSTRFTDPYNNKDGESYYDDFPHYGLIKVECPKCKEVKSECNA